MNISATKVLDQKLPSDIQQTLGGLNLLLIDVFSKARALSFEFFERSFSLHKGIFEEIDPLASKLSDDMKRRVYMRAKRSVFDKKSMDETPINITQKEMKKTVGKLNLILIDAFSSTRAFSVVAFKRLSFAYKDLFKEANVKSSKFSYETKLKLYDSAKGQKSTINIQQSSLASKKKEVLKKQDNLLDSDIEETKTTSEPRQYKRTAIVVALIGVVVLLAYYMFPIFQIDMSKVNKALEVDLVTKRIFYVFNGTEINCYDFRQLYADGKCVQRTLSNNKYFTIVRRFNIDCQNLSSCGCKAKCMSAKKSIFW